MSDDVRRGRVALDDASLEAALFELGNAIAVPPAPDIAVAVSVRLRERQVAERRWTVLPVRLRWTFVAALLALLLLAAIAAATGFGLPGLRILFVGPSASPSSSPAPAPATSSSTTAPPGPANATPSATVGPGPAWVRELGTPITLEAGRAAVAFSLFLPNAATVRGSTPSVYLDSSVIQGEIVLVYPANPGLPASATSPVGPTGDKTALFITESRGRVEEGLLGKTLGPGTTITPIDVAGAHGFWITGSPHEIVVMDAQGGGRTETLRNVGDVLVFVRESTLIRIESGLGLQRTLEIARSLR
jgi:hypothetical protein